MKLAFLPFLLCLALSACGSKPAATTEVHHYHLTGQIVSLNAKDQTISVDQAAIPGWMDAMTMEYPVKSKSEFDSLHTGEKIQGTVNDRGDGDYDLSNIQKQVPSDSR